MSRLTRVLLLACAVAALSAVPSFDASGPDRNGSADTAVSDPSHQLTSGIPVARGGHARTTTVDACGRTDRSDPHNGQLAATSMPPVGAASRSARFELVGGATRLTVGTLATCASGRGPPSESAQTSR